MTNLRDLLDSPFIGSRLLYYKQLLDRIIEERTKLAVIEQLTKRIY